VWASQVACPHRAMHLLEDRGPQHRRQHHSPAVLGLDRRQSVHTLSLHASVCAVLQEVLHQLTVLLRVHYFLVRHLQCWFGRGQLVAFVQRLDRGCSRRTSLHRGWHHLCRHITRPSGLPLLRMCRCRVSRSRVTCPSRPSWPLATRSRRRRVQRAAVAALREGAAPVCAVALVAVRSLFLAVSSVVAVLGPTGSRSLVAVVAAGAPVAASAPVGGRPPAAAVAADAPAAAAVLCLVTMSLKSSEDSAPYMIKLFVVTSVVIGTGAKVPSPRTLVGVAAATVVPATPVFSSALEGGAVTGSSSANCRGREL